MSWKKNTIFIEEFLYLTLRQTGNSISYLVVSIREQSVRILAYHQTIKYHFFISHSEMLAFIILTEKSIPRNEVNR